MLCSDSSTVSAELAHCHHHLGGPFKMSNRFGRSILLLLHLSADPHHSSIHLFPVAEYTDFCKLQIMVAKVQGYSDMYMALNSTVSLNTWLECFAVMPDIRVGVRK